GSLPESVLCTSSRRRLALGDHLAEEPSPQAAEASCPGGRRWMARRASGRVSPAHRSGSLVDVGVTESPFAPMTTASAASPAGSARDQGPTAATQAAPEAHPTAKPPITYPVSHARLRAPVTSDGSRPNPTSLTSIAKRATLMVIATVGEPLRKTTAIVVCTAIAETPRIPATIP